MAKSKGKETPVDPNEGESQEGMEARALGKVEGPHVGHQPFDKEDDPGNILFDPMEGEAVAETKAAKKGPSAAQAAYEKLVRVNTTGFDAKRLVLHRKKCAEALAAKQ